VPPQVETLEQIHRDGMASQESENIRGGSV
jgi:hypothetical protein